MIKLSLIISTFNRGEKLLGTLRSLTRQTLPFELFEVAVVNNNSSDNTQTIVERFFSEHPELNLKILFEPRQGLSHARNCGIAATEGEYVVFMDDDEVADENLLKVYYDFFENNSGAVGAGGLMLPVYETKKPRWMSKYTEGPISGTLHLGKRAKPFPKGSFFIGGNMAIRRTAFSRHGLFNPELGRKGDLLLAGEEKDIFNRITSDGTPCYYLPMAVVHHLIPQSRLTEEYFTEVCYRIGCSERVRTKSSSERAYRERGRQEIKKWCGTLVLVAFYGITLQFVKARYLLLMRRQITAGLFAHL